MSEEMRTVVGAYSPIFVLRFFFICNWLNDKLIVKGMV